MIDIAKRKCKQPKTAGERRAILQDIGPEAKLVERKDSTYKKGRDLTTIYRGITTKKVPYIRNGGA